MVAPNGLGPAFERTIEQAVGGDASAFDVLYRTYSVRMKAFATARGARDPDGVANDVLLRVFQNLSSFEGDETAFVRWIFTIARNRLIDLQRRESRRPQIADAEVPERTLPSAETVAMESVSLDDVLDRLAVLTDEQREVIALRLIDDLSLRDVAEIVGRPVTAVKALQRRGLSRLQREILGEVVS